jgi:hypothetical protein
VPNHGDNNVVINQQNTYKNTTHSRHAIQQGSPAKAFVLTHPQAEPERYQ